MLPKAESIKRAETCRSCSEWNPIYAVCLRGHLAHSPTGCPLKKFAPVHCASYDKDCGRVILLRQSGRCEGCGG